MRSHVRTLVGGILCAVLGAAASGASAPVGSAHIVLPDTSFGEPAGFHLDKATLRAQGASAALLEKVGESAYRYHRMLAPQFASRTCYQFRDVRWELPWVAIHGDAHIEQFVVTADTFGLADFDRSGFGPAVVDLVRYAASIHLACREVTWSCNPAQAVTAYFTAYRAALDHPVTRRGPTALVARLRGGPPRDRSTWLQWADNLMRPMPLAEERALREGWPQFIQLMRETSPQRSDSFYRIVRVGTVEIGIGSALEAKTLIRIDGPGDQTDDDLMLEARITPVPVVGECVLRPSNGGSLQMFKLTTLLGQSLPEIFGFLPRQDAREAPELWIQSWDPDYHGLSLADLRNQADLDELAADAGTQLAGYFWTTSAEALRRHQRFAQLRAFDMTEARARDMAREFASETVTEWQGFRRQR